MNCTDRHHAIAAAGAAVDDVIANSIDCKLVQNYVQYLLVAFDSNWDIDWLPSDG